MPTPVGVARQFLAESAAAVLDDAVAVAKRRCHVQTTSLHVISALLALPSSVLRMACARTRSSACSQRLQFRAVELCVGVALDRVSVSKSGGDEPPVSNSLLAAIKRSQANQRRHPETFHLYPQQLSSDSQLSPSISSVKVEMKHFVMSILDDPIVSRVLWDAGFLTQDVKMAILAPLTLSRFSSTSYRASSLFPGISNNLEPGNIRFPFSQPPDSTEKLDQNSKRIVEILLNSNRRNPLLVGVHATDAHKVFIDYLKKGGSGALPREIDGVNMISIEDEISDCSKAEEGLQEEMVRLKFKQVDEMMMDYQEPGIILNCGDLKVFVDMGSASLISYMVSELKRLVISYCKKLWLIGFLAADGDYKKLVEWFPSIEMDLNLHLMPITTASNAENSFKSSCSLLRSFVPLGGFFSMPSENESLSTTAAKTLGLCNLCSEKYELEVSDLLKGVSTNALAVKELRSLPLWLQAAESETSKKTLTAGAKEDKSVLDSRVMASKRKWSDICWRLHSSPTTSQGDISRANPSNAPNISSFQSFSVQNSVAGVGSSLKGISVISIASYPGPELSRPIFPRKCVNAQANIAGRGLNLNDLCRSSDSQEKADLPAASCATPSTPLCSVTTNLRLGTLYDSNEESERKLIETSSGHQIFQSSSCWPHLLEKNMNSKDLKNPWAALAEKVYWQTEAIQTISRVVSRCRSGNKIGNVWLSLLGPDRVGKRKIASGVAEIVFGRKENLLSLDLNSPDVISPITSVFDFYVSKHQRLNLGRKMIVDYLAEELSKHPHSVVLLENFDRADFLVRESLCRAIKTGKFPNSHGRDIIINNVFFLASAVLKAGQVPFSGKVTSDFPEDKILEARNLQMQILVGPLDSSYIRNYTMINVSVTPIKILSKRKSRDHHLTRGEISKCAFRPSSIIDLNLPVEDAELDFENFPDADGTQSDGSDARLEELLESVDENVVFKPFDFDSLSRKILTDIDGRLKKAVGPLVVLEIDREVMLQILAAAWLTEEENALVDWVEKVLCSGLEEARQRCGISRDVLMKLLPCDGRVVEARSSGLCLPARINLD